MKKNYYKCECGKEFDNPQKFNGHKSHCKIHALVNNKLDFLDYITKYKQTKAHKAKSKNSINRKEKELKNWIDEKHTCEHCGKIMTERYGSGRFCCRGCANSRNKTEAINNKTSSTAKKTKKLKYINNPKQCQVCGKVLSWEDRHKKICSNCKEIKHNKKNEGICAVCGKIFKRSYYNQKHCSKECSNKQRSETRKKLFLEGKIMYQNIRHTYKYGTYRDIYCDSSWELAFVLYCLDNGLDIIRNNKISFEYEYNNEKHLYFPDFIVNNILYEIKGRVTPEVICKVNCIPKNISYRILYSSDMKKYINYAIQKYGKDFDKLYDKSKPSWLDKLK